MQGCLTHFDLHRRDDVTLATPLIKSMTEIVRFRKVGQAGGDGGLLMVRWAGIGR